MLIDMFNEVKKLVEEGFTISQALLKLKINGTKFYKDMTELQKVELRHANKANTTWSTAGMTVKRNSKNKK